MADLWYFETRKRGGGWAPGTSSTKPTAKTPDGSSTRLREDSARLVDPNHHHLTLDQLQASYSIDGAFRSSTYENKSGRN